MDRLAPLYSMLPPLPAACLGRTSALFRKSTIGRLASRRMHAFDFSGESPDGFVRPKCVASATPDRATDAVGHFVRAVPRRWDSLSPGDITCLCRCPAVPRGVDGGGLDRGDDRASARSNSARSLCENEASGWESMSRRRTEAALGQFVPALSQAFGTAKIVSLQWFNPICPRGAGDGQWRERRSPPATPMSGAESVND